jgi:hypothetical protein
MKIEIKVPAIIYGLTILLSAFLLFQVQPMVAKAILPWYGGSPGGMEYLPIILSGSFARRLLLCASTDSSPLS